MNKEPKAFKGLGDIFDVTPIEEEPTNSFPAIYNEDDEKKDTTLDEDVKFVKNKLKGLISQSEDFTGYAISIAQSTQESKDLAVVLESFKLQSSLLSKLISVQKKETPKEKDTSPSKITNQTMVFTGNADEVLKRIRGEENGTD